MRRKITAEHYDGTYDGTLWRNIMAEHYGGTRWRNFTLGRKKGRDRIETLERSERVGGVRDDNV